MSQDSKPTMEEFSQFLKNKAFIYQSSDIYGGLAGVYDYGHNGTALKNNWMNMWRKFFLGLHEDFVEIDASIIMHEDVFKASGHLANFFDPIAHTKSGATARADHLVEEATGERVEGLNADELFAKIKEHDIKIGKEEVTKVENLNMMFPVSMGPTKGVKAYLRPETAQSPYVNFRLQHELMRKRVPIGLGMIGRVYRNEISPRNLVLRTRELEQAELQIFFNPNKVDEHPQFDEIANYELRVVRCDGRDAEPVMVSCADLAKSGIPKFYVYHMAKMQQFYFDYMKVNPETFRFLELTDEEKAFYNKNHFDIEIKMTNPDQWIEVGGVHYRTDHDLKGHQEVSKVKMEVIDESTGDRFIPHVLELSLGLGRNLYTLLDQAYDNSTERGNAIMHIPKKLAPITVGVFPLMKKNGLPEVAQKIIAELREEDITYTYDVSGSVGRRYARADEIGIPYCVTIDFETLDDDCVTVRDRETTDQERVKISELSNWIRTQVKK